MLQKLLPLLVALLAAVPAAALAADKPAEPFELKDGDRVLFVGGTFVEREGQLGYIEAALTARFADRNVTFRNLGQSGDTALADARNLNAGWVTFGPPDQGFKRLTKLVGEIKPTVVIANYGMTESFAGPAKLDEFKANYNTLLDAVVQAAGTNPRVVLWSPNFHEDLGRPLPDPKQHNDHLKLYRDAIREMADKRSARFVDVYALTEHMAIAKPGEHLTDNGIHLTPAGYKRLANALVEVISGKVRDPSSATREVMSEAALAEKIRPLIVAKNAEYFNYWRPQNDTYILGYRKKEQGRNAVEMPQFIPLAEAKEKEIAAAVGRK